MCAFPIYRSNPPERLNLLNWRHYMLLVYWIFFRPSRLDHYLNQIDLEIDTEQSSGAIFRHPSARSLPVMIVVTTIAFTLLAGFVLVLASNLIQSRMMDYYDYTFTVFLCTALGITFCTVFSIPLSLVKGPALGITFGGTFGIVLSVTLCLMIGLGENLPDVSLSAAFGCALGLAYGSAFVSSLFVIRDLAFGVGSGVILGITSSAAFSLLLGWLLDTSFGVAFFTGSSFGTLRLPYYPLQFALSLVSLITPWPHPLDWDEMLVLPLLGVKDTILPERGQKRMINVALLIHTVRNPFQRWVIQRTLHSYLHSLEDPLQLLYTFLSATDLDTFIFPSREDSATTREVLLAEISGEFVDCGGNALELMADFLIWMATWAFRRHRETRLTRFTKMLYQLLDENTIMGNEFDLSAYADVYTSLTAYPSGQEVAWTYTTMGMFLSYDELSNLPDAVHMVENRLLSFDNTLRPVVLTSMDRLCKIGAEIATYYDATSRVNKLAALARTTDELDDLDEYITSRVMVPERYILRQITRRWRRLVSEVGGEIGRDIETSPLPNPYVAGNPVVGDIFAGRKDILRRLEELWSGAGQKPSVVLYGHRRMGKSSILHNLGSSRFGLRTVIVDFNMQRVGLVESTDELLHNLALALYDAQTLRISQTGDRLDEPGEEDFLDHNPYTAFDRFLKRLNQVRDDHRFIVTVDEFELIEQLITEEKLEPRLLDFWRGLIQTYPWFVMAFAGLHTLQEMTHDYWHPLYGSVLSIPVSFLKRAAARRLITQPTPEFPLDYDQQAVERIYGLTNGQPYLIQLIGHGLVTRFNRQAFEEGIERERRFGVDDVEAVINAPEFYRDGDAYFTGVWRQAEVSEPDQQTAVLVALAQEKKGLPVAEIARRAEILAADVESALRTLARHDVVAEVDDCWHFTVELMRRWVLRREREP